MKRQDGEPATGGRQNLVDAPTRGVSHIGIQVADLDRSVAFYEGLLGLHLAHRLVRDNQYIQELVGYPDVAVHIAILRDPYSEVFLEILEYRNVDRQSVDPRTANPGTAHLCFYVDDLTAQYERLSAAGVAFVSRVMEPTDSLNAGGKAVYLLDPDG